ncbi:hypothetical protein Lal_00038627 [Lupinus albus]|nr:hypothetical protein Lal_00038627 [Lupinus albus]
MTTNLAECVNDVLKGSRAFPITALFRATYHRLNSWFAHHRDEASSMVRASHIYCEELTKFVIFHESGVFEVEVVARDGSRHSKIYRVRLMQNWCDCGEFQSFRLSCSHTIATCASLKLDYGQFISPIYRLDNILKVYGHEFQPIGPTFIPNSLMRRNRTGKPKTTPIHNEINDSPSE